MEHSSGVPRNKTRVSQQENDPIQKNILKILKHIKFDEPVFKNKISNTVNWHFVKQSTGKLELVFKNLKNLPHDEHIRIYFSRSSLGKCQMNACYNNYNREEINTLVKKCLNLGIPLTGVLNERILSTGSHDYTVIFRSPDINKILQFLNIVDLTSQSFGKHHEEKFFPSEFAASMAQEITAATTSHLLVSAPDHWLSVLPEHRRNIAQRAGVFLCEQWIYYAITGMMSKRISAPVGLAICSAIIISKAILIRDNHLLENQKPAAYTIQDLKIIAQSVAQNSLTEIMYSKMITHCTSSNLSLLAQMTLKGLANHSASRNKIVTSYQKLIPFIFLLLTPFILNARIPGIEQTDQAEENATQQLGHLLANAEIMASMRLILKYPIIGSLGCSAGIIANTFFGKKQHASRTYLHRDPEDHSFTDNPPYSSSSHVL